MYELNKKLEQIGEVIKANEKFDLNLDIKTSDFKFFVIKNNKDVLIKKQLFKSINRQITKDDQL